MSQPEFHVEVASIDQHGDPGFVHYRGAFYTSRSAGQFALTQAAALADTYEIDAVSAVIDSVTDERTRRDVEFIGSPGELAAELTSLPAYASGARRTVIPAPRDVTAAVDAVLRLSPSLPDTAVGEPGVIDVEVYSTRPGPIPNSRTEVGAYRGDDARRIAASLAADLGGTIEPMRSDTVLRVTHTAAVSDTDRIAVQRFREVERMRANLSVLDPVADAEYITALAGDLEELRARRAPAAGSAAATTVASPSVDLDRAATRPRGLVSAPPARVATAVAVPSPARTAPQATHTQATARAAEQGLG